MLSIDFTWTHTGTTVLLSGVSEDADFEVTFDLRPADPPRCLSSSMSEFTFRGAGVFLIDDLVITDPDQALESVPDLPDSGDDPLGCVRYELTDMNDTWNFGVEDRCQIVVMKGGNDHVWLGSRHDVGYGDAGDDQIAGEGGWDNLYGGTGWDRLFGSIGNDNLYGGDGADILDGNDGSDLVEGNLGDDVVLGGRRADNLHGGGGDDQLIGQSGDDYLGDAGSGSDTDLLCGRGGNDVQEVGDGDWLDTSYGGDGRDNIRGSKDSGDDVSQTKTCGG